MHRSLFALAALAVVSAAHADDLVDNPAYQSWARFQVGATVEYLTVQDAAGNRSETKMVYKLIESTAEKVVVEMKMSTVMAGQTYDQPAMPVEYLARMKASDLEAAKDPNVETSEGTESVELGGRTYDAKWSETRSNANGMTTTSRTWMSDEIPGTFLKSTMKIEGPMNMANDTVLVSVQASAK